MATYPVINTNTVDQIDVVLTVHSWEQCKTDNPDWTRDGSDPSTCPSSGDVGD